MVNGFRFYSDALGSIKNAYRPKPKRKSKEGWAGLGEAVGSKPKEEDKISLVGYWVYSINPAGKISDYADVPLEELLEAFAVWSHNRKTEFEFRAATAGIKI